MIRRIPFHEGNSLPLYGVSYDDGGPIPHILCLFQRLNYLTKIESVNLKDVPVESLPFVCQRLHRHDLFSQTILLYSISDRKSTRLNSSHRTISYAVFCLKKKKLNALLRKSAMSILTPIRKV